MLIDSDLPPVPQMSFDDLLLECIDALEHPSMDGDDRETHLQLVGAAVNDNHLDAALRKVLLEVVDIFRHQGMVHPLDDPDPRTERLVTALTHEAGEAVPRYVYHGTIFGRLPLIAKEGLVPGGSKVWRQGEELRPHCDSAVFFTPSWREAIQWAMAAHCHSHGPSKGRHRMPAIIRLPANGLALEPDPRAAAPGCLMVRSSVPLADPHVILGKLSGFPNWRPLAEVLATK